MRSYWFVHAEARSVPAASAAGCCRRGRSRLGRLAGVWVPAGAVGVGAGGGEVRGRDAGGTPTGDDGATGIDDPIEPIVSLPRGFGLVGSVKFVVVSTFVFVSGGVVSPGPLIVDVTPLAEPSCTVWYCC